MKDISILLTTYGRPQECMYCLESLLSQKTEKVEIILLDDLHINNPELIDFCFRNDIEYLHTGAQKEGKPLWRVPGFALNIGARHSVGNYLILGNAEILHISPNTVQLMYNTGTVAFPRGWDQPDKDADITQFRRWKRLLRLPFFMGVPKKVFFDIGGYDEDFTGYAAEDNDLVDRLDLVAKHVEVDADIVHLWNPRGISNRAYASNLKPDALHFNRNIWRKKKGILVRNEGREWGKL